MYMQTHSSKGRLPSLAYAQRKRLRNPDLRLLRFEALEHRRLLSIDLDITRFCTDSESFDLQVNYCIDGDSSPPFDIGIYRSVDSVSPGLLLTTYRVDKPEDLTAVEPHTVFIHPNFEDAPVDYYLLAKLDCYDDVAEVVEGDTTEEGNNVAKFEGGVFLGADRTTKVVGRHVFYDNSAFDGYTPGPNHDPEGDSDDNAIAPDKFALLPGQQATFRNYTSYDKGMNRIVINTCNPCENSTFTMAV